MSPSPSLSCPLGDPPPRCISETHYQLAVAQAHCGEWAQAEASLNAAIAVLETRVRNFAKVDKTEEITKEIAEVEAIIAGIKERVTDFKDMAQGVFREDMVEVVASSKLASGLGLGPRAAVGLGHGQLVVRLRDTPGRGVN